MNTFILSTNVLFFNLLWHAPFPTRRLKPFISQYLPRPVPDTAYIGTSINVDGQILALTNKFIYLAVLCSDSQTSMKKWSSKLPEPAHPSADYGEKSSGIMEHHGQSPFTKLRNCIERWSFLLHSLLCARETRIVYRHVIQVNASHKECPRILLRAKWQDNIQDLALLRRAVISFMPFYSALSFDGRPRPSHGWLRKRNYSTVSFLLAGARSFGHRAPPGKNLLETGRVMTIGGL